MWTMTDRTYYWCEDYVKFTRDFQASIIPSYNKLKVKLDQIKK